MGVSHDVTSVGDASLNGEPPEADENRWQPTYLAWLDRAWPGHSAASTRRSSTLVAAGDDLCQTACTRPQGTTEALRRFGAAAGSEGWGIEKVFEWVGHLAAIAPRRVRRNLQSMAAHHALAVGWADEFVRGTRSCIDAASGITTAEVLVERIEETYRFCQQAGVTASTAFTLVIVDVVDDHGGLSGMMSLAAQAVSDEFADGETAARIGSRIVVLSASAMTTDERLDGLRARLGRALGSCPSLVWREALPDRRDDLGRLLADYGIAVTL